MIKRNKTLDDFEKEQIKKDQPDYFRNLMYFEALYREAVTLKVFPLKDPLEGIEVDIRLARALNLLHPNQENRSDAGHTEGQ